MRWERSVRVLVTGGAGFIGSQLVRELLARGAAVVVLDLLTYAGRRWHLDGLGVDLRVGDVTDHVAVAEAMDGCDAVMHLAAESHVTRSLGDAAPFFRTNLEGTRTVLEAALDAGIDRVVHMSTDEVFGSARSAQASGPDAPFRPGNPYAASKVAAEAVVMAWWHSFGSQANIVRCTNNYGPRQHPEKAIPCWTLAALAGGPIAIHGRGTPRRDWLHVSDCARGLADILEQWRSGHIWHLAGGSVQTNHAVATAVGRLCGVQQIVCGPDRPGQDDVYLLDDTNTRAVLGWAPSVSLEDGLAETVAWYRAHQGRLWKRASL
ncbi:MAG: dTDP-glucose 4,6-dehydratase [Deltaproteobacteria bacterium]|nr:dTDP-glucose 4,6-dehydratase [Deltaproteobacteria bacterium]HCH66069.1 dTDP-glucose 4,6-dehydratase [Deltaproteobacteria bacterium]